MASNAIPRSPRSLADDLRGRTAGQVTRLLRLRPDLLHPWPADLSQLARRAADDASVLEAMQSLSTVQLRVLEVFACLHEGTIEDTEQGLPDDPEQVRAAVDRLWSMALLWGGPQVYRITRAAQQAFGAHPCGLSAAGHAAVDDVSVRAAAAGWDTDELEDLLWHDPVRQAADPLLIPRGDHFVLARESALVLRDGAFLRPVDPPAPAPDVTPAGNVLMWAPLAGVRYVLTDLAREPLPWHPVRGVSRRTVNDRSASMNAPADDLLTWLELAAIAGLIGPANDTVRPTPAAETWLHADPAAMWATLVDSWLDSDRPLGACQPEELGSLTLTGKPRTAHHRRHVLAVWPPHADLLQETVAWERPRMHEAQAQAAGFLDEAVRLGLVVGGVPTVAMTALPDDVAAAAAEVPAADSGGLIVQPDHTVIAPLSVDTGTWRLLQDVAHVESWGPVTTHRIDPARLRTVVAGREPDELLQRLARMSRTPLPQSVEYLVADAARATAARVYRATVVEAGGADTAALTELGLTRVTDHLFTTDLPLTVVEQQLAAAGISVAAHAEPVAGTPFDVQRVAAVPDEHSVNRLVGLLLGEHALSDVGPPTLQDADPATMVDVCLEAIGKEQRLWVQYPDGDLDRIELIEPIEVRSGRLTGWSLTAGRTLGVPLARIAAYRSAQ